MRSQHDSCLRNQYGQSYQRSPRRMEQPLTSREEVTRTPKDCWTTGNKLNCNCANDRGCRRLDVVLSQFAAANATLHPELNGHVEAMETRGFWREAQYSPNPGQGYHWFHNAESYVLIGEAMGQGMIAATEK
eukprot:m.81670 g.81670  ORF g.81670 m.81670 type:complete len:132 (+) comp12821_c0_seq1:742-1137(+)